MLNEPTKLNSEDAVLITNWRIEVSTHNTSEILKNTLILGTTLPGYDPKITQWKMILLHSISTNIWSKKSTAVFWDDIFKNQQWTISAAL